MRTTSARYAGSARYGGPVALGIAMLTITGQAGPSAQPHRDPAIRIGDRDLGGVVTSANGREAGVYWGDERIWDSQTSLHNPMRDETGRVWFTSRVGPSDNPAFCKKGSDHPSAMRFPLDQSTRHLARYDPKTGTFTLIRTCFPTHHLQFGFDANQTLWTSAGGPQAGVVGWLNRKRFEETGDEATSRGWTALILDTNGNGRRDDYVEPDQPVDLTKDKRINAAFYGIAPSPVDGSVWGSVLGFPGAIVRLNPGSAPPATALAEIYEPPWPGYSPRGMDVDRRGVVWAPLASGHLASFDRRKCVGPLNGPTATGPHCPEGWTLYPFPGPQFKSVTDPGSAEASYYSFFAKGLDGRIDDPNAGWKGRGVWTTFGNRTPFHLEGGKGTTPKVVKFQVRPDPLAR